MKNFFFILLLLGTVAAVFLYLNPELRHEAQALLQSSGLQPKAPSIVYKWRDRSGQWQYSQSPPPKGTPFEEVEARSDVNIMPLPEALKNK